MNRAAGKQDEGSDEVARRADRIAALREAVRSGTYRVPAGAVADRIVERALRSTDANLRRVSGSRVQPAK